MKTAAFLIVEDEAMIAMLIEDCLEDLGFPSVVICDSVDGALDNLSVNRVSAAILDVNLGQETSWPVALALQSANIPFLVSSGNADVDFPDNINAVPVLAKPFTHAALEDAVGKLTA